MTALPPSPRPMLAGRYRSVFFISIIVSGWLLLAGCATWPAPTPSVHLSSPGPAGTCAQFFAFLDEQVVRHDAVDGGLFKVPRYPYLRTDRFAASFATDIDREDSFRAWLDHMQALDRSARRSEIANLPDEAAVFLRSAGGRQAVRQQASACGDLLKTLDFEGPGRRDKLRQAVRVPDDYIAARRALGLYPLTRLFVSQGVSRWHRTARGQFSPDSPQDWKSVWYVPAGPVVPSAVSRIVKGARRDALNIPAYTRPALLTLFRSYAPIWQVQKGSNDDRIGWPHWQQAERIGVDTDRPVTFTRLSFTRFDDTVLTQLNYIIWYPSRPKRGAWDIYGGVLDGLNYRVTLDSTGTPILYETIHNCGCYYKAYPTARLLPRESMDYAEKPLILEAPRPHEPSVRMVVAMERATHSVRHMYPVSRASGPGKISIPYVLAAYDRLKSLPRTQGKRRSMFNRYGIVEGSERLERWILWPTGVLSPGAMRQWGRHAVAFAGKRHFDDPFYMEKMFRFGEPRDPP